MQIRAPEASLEVPRIRCPPLGKSEFLRTPSRGEGLLASRGELGLRPPRLDCGAPASFDQRAK
eukprot:385466-Alexandrium_andersonii.AAC.1